MLKKFFILINLVVVACAPSLTGSPTIYFSNLSSGVIKNINCQWAGKNTLTLSAIDPGDSRSQSFIIKNNADFFGRVKISWINDEGQAIRKEFSFTKKDLPSIEDSDIYSYVQIYLDKDNVEYITSDDPELEIKTQKKDQSLLKYHNQYLRNHSNKVDNALISVDSQEESDIPIGSPVAEWLPTFSNMY